MEDLEILKNKAREEIKLAKEALEVDELEAKFLGKKGILRKYFSWLKSLPPSERKKLGQKLNQIKEEIEKAILQKRKELKEVPSREFLDLTLPSKKVTFLGRLHPLSQIFKEFIEFFLRLGFEVLLGPEIEDEWHNFDGLNIPRDHPARDLWNTIWLKDFKGKLLRTHTSPVQLRAMEQKKPPLKVIVPGRVFRYEATDPSHEIQFHQLEGLWIDKNISLVNLKAILTLFLKEIFGQEVQLRFRPGFFPFTEPSLEVDILKDKKWVEVLGAGMVHPNVLKNGKIDPKKWQGFAFGLGVERLAMIKWGINDIRLFFGNDLRFLNQF